jgi:sulfur-oxidizing protein SoxY
MSISRRTFVHAAVGGAVISMGFGAGILASRRVKAALPPQTFFAPSPNAAVSAVLGTDQTPLDAAVELEIPSMVEVADMVPLTVATTLDDVESITIVADDNPNPIIAYYRLTPQLWPYIATRVRLAKSGNANALVKAGGTVHRASKHVAISISGCGDAEPDPERISGPQKGQKPGHILVRTQKSDDGLIFRAIISHPMTPPLKDPKTGTPTPGYFIEEVEAQVNGKPVLNGDWSAGVARDPYLSFKLRQAAPGDVIRLSWKDTSGNTGSKEVTVG